MPRLIEGAELKKLQPVIHTARLTALEAECAKDSRGVVVFRGEHLIATAANGPEWPNTCDGVSCRAVCGLFAIHAERRALMRAIATGEDLSDTSMLHLRLDSNQIQTSGPLRCEDCSGYLLRAVRKGIGLREFILLQSTGLMAYSISEMDLLTRINLKLS